MSRATYPHRATRQLEALEPLNAPRLHDQIYQDILIAGLGFRKDEAEKCQPGIDLLRSLTTAYRDYSEEAGRLGDMFGEYLECNGQTSERNGQFFTPPDIVDMIVAMQFNDVDLARPEPYTVCDPACGTGRFMLSVAEHFARHNDGALNFLMTNIDIDRKAFVYCTMNAVLNGIPGIHIHGDTLRMDVWDAIATIPIGKVATWGRVAPERAKALIIQALKTPAPPVSPTTTQTTLEVGA